MLILSNIKSGFFTPRLTTLCLVPTRAHRLSAATKCHGASRARAGREQSGRGRLGWLVLLLLGGFSGAPGALADSLSVTHAYGGLSTDSGGATYTSTLTPNIQLLDNDGAAVTDVGIAIPLIADVMVAVAGISGDTCVASSGAPDNAAPDNAAKVQALFDTVNTTKRI